MKAAGRALATAVLAALFGAAFTALFYAWHPAILLDFDRDVPRAVTGIYPSEYDRGSRLSFAWTSGYAAIRLPGLDRRVPWTLEMRVRSLRADSPELTVDADGAILTVLKTTPDFQDLRVTIPASPGRRGLVIGIASSRTFVPGPGDRRQLGVMLDRLALTADGIVLVPRPAMLAAAIAAGAMGAAIALVGVTAGSAIGGAVVLAAGTAAIAARGFAPFTTYPSTLVQLGCWIALLLAVASLATEWRRARPLRNTARFAVAFSASALFLKLIVLFHPNMPIGDALFHAHRFETVLSGNLFFTSIAPGGYAFPYPPGLYVFASLFSGFVRRSADVSLLRIVTCSVDVIAGLLLYRIVDRGWGNRLAAAMAVAIFNLMPLDFSVITTGNLTNAFAQSVAIGALAIAAAPGLTIRRLGPTLALTWVLAAAFLSHTSTVAILFVAALAIAAMYAWHGGPALRGAALAVAAAAFVAAAIAVVVYYAHFMDTYRAEFARIGHETATGAPAAGGRSIADRARYVPFVLGFGVGAPVLLFAFLGAVELAQRTERNRLTLALAGWITSCAIFLVVGVVTPVDMRHELAALPALAIAAAYGAAWAWNDGWPEHKRVWRLAAAVFLAGAITTGFHHWWSILGPVN